MPCQVLVGEDHGLASWDETQAALRTAGLPDADPVATLQGMADYVLANAVVQVGRWAGRAV